VVVCAVLVVDTRIGGVIIASAVTMGGVAAGGAGRGRGEGNGRRDYCSRDGRGGNDRIRRDCGGVGFADDGLARQLIP
jgi:hypothetical protein